ncbi:MAG: 4Fe-4S binding protein, partial [Anaerolineaceae bacterium]|nr:4Fe-4S binding protein [Anaerolineaceae bacterium]
WICPMGTIIDLIKPKCKVSLKSQSLSWLKIVKYLLFFILIISALFGNQTLTILDPITILNRTISSSIFPAAQSSIYGIESFFYRFEFMWDLLDKIHTGLLYPIFHDIQTYSTAAFPFLLILVVIIGLNWWKQSFWCRYLCPLGGLLGLVSKFSIFRRKVTDSCTACKVCAHKCPTGTIDAEVGFLSDPSECTFCFECIESCPYDANNFQWTIKDWHKPQKRDVDLKRREVLLSLGATIGLVALARIEPINNHTPATLLRPPGAVRGIFESRCLRCTACINICPTQGLQPSLFEGGWSNVMTPILIPRLGYCEISCKACTEICPSEAIPKLSLEEKQASKIGLASVNRNRCLPWAYATACIICEEACPLPDKAIELEEDLILNEQGEQVIIQKPIVIKEKCIGCGVCEHQCPMGGEAAIRVFSQTELSFSSGNYW